MNTTNTQPPGSESLSQPDLSLPDTLTSDQSLPCNQPSLPDSLNAISSPGSVGGASRCNSQAGTHLDLFGRGRVPVNPTPSPGSRKATPTLATSGRHSQGSSESVSLQQSLESRLKARFGTGGSIEYAETWKLKATPAGRQYWAHTASAHRTSDNDCSGWPTCQARDHKGASLNQKDNNTRPLNEVALLTGWPTPSSQGSAGETSEDLERVGNKWRNKNTGRILQTNLATDVKMLAGWGTPSCMDGLPIRSDEALARAKEKAGCCNVKDQIPTSGLTVTSSNAATEKRGALNPAFSRWLMGFPAEWDSCGATAMQSCRKSQRSS